jgi:hypothetical protein
MLNHRIASCVNLFILISFFIFSPNAIAQSKINNLTVKKYQQKPLAISKTKSNTIQKKTKTRILQETILEETIKEKPLTTRKVKNAVIPKKKVIGALKKRIGKKPAISTSKIKRAVIPKTQINRTLEISKKISLLEKELLKTKSALSLERKTKALRDKQISKLASDLKSIKSQVVQKDKELLKTKSALSLEQKNRVSRDKQITKLTTDLTSMKSKVSQNEAELIKLNDAYEEAKTLNFLYDEIKILENLLSERETELVDLKDAYEKSNATVLKNVISCYSKAFNIWDKMHKIRSNMAKEASQHGLVIISAELRKAINNCPPI